MPAKEIIWWTSQALWLIVSILLLVHLNVFAPKSLANAPARRSNLSLLTVAGVVLLYIGLLATTQVALTLFYQPPTTLAPGGNPRPSRAPTPHASSTTSPISPTTSRPTPQDPHPLPPTSATTSATTQPSPPPPTEDPHVEMILQLADAFTKAVPSALILFLCSRLVLGGIDGWGLSLRKLPKGIGYGLLGLLVVYPTLIVVNVLVSLALEYFKHKEPDTHPTLQLLAQHDIPLYERVVFASVAGIAAPILEEIFFRGLLQTVFMERGWGISPHENTGTAYRPSVSHRWLAITAASAIFAGIHLMPDSFLVLFTLAMALGYLYERTNNLWACITLHAAFNCLNIYLYTHS